VHARARYSVACISCKLQTSVRSYLKVSRPRRASELSKRIAADEPAIEAAEPSLASDPPVDRASILGVLSE